MVHHNEHATLCLVGIFLIYCFSMRFEVLDSSIYVLTSTYLYFTRTYLLYFIFTILYTYHTLPVFQWLLLIIGPAQSNYKQHFLIVTE